MSKVSIYLQTQADYTIREEMYKGRPHIVVPVVMMVEGVHNGSAGPIYHPISELGHIPDAWNGIPVTINHPAENGQALSANSPHVIEEWSVGRIFNTHVEGTKLKAEAWLDKQTLEEKSPDALAHIQNGDPLDVSVGVFSDEDRITGLWNNEEYIAIARNHRPDHLALLPGGVGACSWADGCGIRTNKEGGLNNVSNFNEVLIINALKYSGTESTQWSAPSLSDFGVSGNWDTLSAADKSKVASHFLIGSASAPNFEALKLPVVNPRTGRLNEGALRAVISGRGAQVTGVTAEVKSAARRRAYRLLNAEFNANLSIPQNLSILNYVKDGEDVELTINELGLLEQIEALRRLVDAMDNQQAVHYLKEVYDAEVIYKKITRSDAKEEYYKQGYRVTNDNTVEFTGDPVQVKRKVTYVNAQEFRRVDTHNKKQITNMCTPCVKNKVNALIANEATRFTEDNRVWLEGLEEAQLDAMMPTEPKATPPGPQGNEAGDDKGGKAAPLTRASLLAELFKEPMTMEEYSKFMPKEVQEQVTTGLRVHAQQKTAMIKTILDNTAEGVWDEATLKTFELDMLQKIAQSTSTQKVTVEGLLGNPGVYLSQTPQRTIQNNAPDEIMLPTGVKPKEQAQA